MAYADVVNSQLVRIWVNAVTPTGGSRLCAMQQKNFNQTKEMNDQVVPDCAAPAAPGQIRRTIISKDIEITGSGLYTPGERNMLQNIFDSPSPWPTIFQMPASQAGTIGGYWSGKFFLTQFNTIADGADFVTVDLTWMVDGTATWSNA